MKWEKVWKTDVYAKYAYKNRCTEYRECAMRDTVSRQQAVSLSRAFFVSPGQLTDERGGGGGAKSYDGKKAFPLEIIIYSLLCEV